MADPIGITGTAVGIVSLCLQLYGGLKNYLDNFRDRDEYISKALLRLDLLRSLTNDVESTIPTLQSGHYAPSQAVLLSLKACETEMKSLDAELQKFKGTTSVNLREKLKEAKRKVQFPFARSELDKLVCGLDRMNSLLKLALQGLQLHVQSANQGKLIDIDDTARTALASIAKVDTKIDEIQSRGAALEAGIRSNEITITDISRNIHGLSHATTEIRSSVSQINQIQANTSSSIGLLRDLSVGHQAQRVNTVILEERMSELTYAITHANDNSPQERFFKMLMSKPDVLRRWQDDVATLGHVPSDDPPEDAQELSRLKRKHQMHSKAGNCGCRYRRHVSRQSSRWLIFTRFDESIVDYHHDPGCPRYSNPGETREYTAGIIYTGLHRLLNIAVVASLTSRYGAGGASISPTFRYYAMVDSRQSPAFGIVRRMALVILNMCVYTYDSVGMHDSKATDMACQQIIRVGISKLRRIFTSRSSLPTDINERGWTLIESCVDYYTLFDRDMWDHPNAKGMTRSLLQSLLELGVPRMTDSSNSYQPPLAEFIESFPNTTRTKPDIKEIIMLLFPEQPENYTWKLSREALINPIFRIWLAEIDGMREVYGLDQPLFTALLRKDEPMLKRVLRTPSTSSDSLISNGIPAIHIAVFWPKGLELLLRLRQDADINMSYDGKTPLDLAICISGQTCEQKHDILCHSCGCAESLKILLEYGCRLTRYTLWWRWNMYQRSLNVVRVLLNHIKSWREQLTEIARRELSEADCHNIGIRESSVLDHAAPKVIRKLEARGVCPSKELQLDLDDYRLSPQSDGSESSSLYHDLHDTSAMEIAFKLGFRDSDVFYQAETPVMRKFLRFRYYEWFLDHGVDITNLVPLRVESAPTVQIPDWTVAHHIMSQAGTYGDRINTYDRLLLKLGNLDLGDSCECACSELEGGCSPLKVFLIPQMRYLGPILDNLWHLIKDFDACGPMPPTAAVAVIRVCTFEVLGIRHTCCATGSCYNEDFSHIRDEDESLLVELEELMADFKDRFHFKEQSLSQFMKGYWKDRMEQNKQEKDARRLSQEEIDVAASLGIILREESPEKEQISEEYKREYTCVWDVVEDCIRKLDEIYM